MYRKLNSTVIIIILIIIIIIIIAQPTYCNNTTDEIKTVTNLENSYVQIANKEMNSEMLLSTFVNYFKINKI